jgi:hypothetical protein
MVFKPDTSTNMKIMELLPTDFHLQSNLSYMTSMGRRDRMVVGFTTNAISVLSPLML